MSFRANNPQVEHEEGDIWITTLRKCATLTVFFGLYRKLSIKFL